MKAFMASLAECVPANVAEVIAAVSTSATGPHLKECENGMGAAVMFQNFAPH
ncbi:hypothetical protein [Duganella sp. HH101]|uniref:hypothetical protein n=1 Tax=Duganella sp. HH101 TaxID=1781066 RepID=UPI00143ACFAB|nr:hypothetical protein [Duganella sp. HH101]